MNTISNCFLFWKPILWLLLCETLAPVLYFKILWHPFALCRSSSSFLSWSLSRWERVIKDFLWDAIFLHSTSFNQFNTNGLSSPKRDKNNKQCYSHLLIFTRFQTQTYGRRRSECVFYITHTYIHLWFIADRYIPFSRLSVSAVQTWLHDNVGKQIIVVRIPFFTMYIKQHHWNFSIDMQNLYCKNAFTLWALCVIGMIMAYCLNLRHLMNEFYIVLMFIKKLTQGITSAKLVVLILTIFP